MKKTIALLFILAACCIRCPAQSLVFDNQTIVVAAQNLAVESVEFQPLEVVTNTVIEWSDPVDVVTTNGLFDGFTLETNSVQQQTSADVVSTNAPVWICNVIFALPSGYLWDLNGFPVTIQRFKTSLAVPVDPAVVAAAFGPAAAGLEFAASNGAYQPTGQVKDAFLSFVAAALAGGVE